GVIDDAQLKAALGHQRRWGGRLGQALVHLNLAREEDVVDALGRKFGYEVAALDPGALEPYALQQALALVPRDVAVRNHLLPIAADTSTLTVAMSDPTNVQIVDELRFRTGRRVVVKIAGELAIATALKVHYPAPPGAGAVDAIPLDLDDAAEARIDALLDPFGGGSTDELEAFFSAQGEAHASADAAPAAVAAGDEGDFGLELEEGTPPHGLRVPAHPPAAPAAEEEPQELTMLEELPAEDLVPENAVEPAGSWFDAGPLEPGPRGAARSADDELAVLGEVDRLASGLPVEEPTIVKPERIAAALARLLIRKGVITDQEFLDELLKR
ncbi:MAG TPA: hypothetical protein VD838_17840, partial [Anaeromyxobacteraceae bacterium]|nr:hypothetical protein [Anaeromyxobacteraceae bacterium]